MSARTAPLAAGLGALLLLAGALAGCATPVTGESPSPEGSASEPSIVEVDAAWLDGGSMVAVLLEGSSTCVPMADDVSYADGVLSVSMLEPADTACTRDLVLRGIPVTLPEGVDPAQDLRVEVTGEQYSGATELAGVEGLAPGAGMDGGVPSAGWAATPGTFAVLSWGSSSCRPVFEGAAVSAVGEIAVTFATPPADQVCTADYTARVSVVTVEGAEPGSAYTATLSGDSFDGTAVPIAGVPA